MTWFWGSLIGSTSLVILNTLSKKIHFEGWYIILLSILSIFTTWAFWYAWQHSTGFLRVWFVQSAMVTIGAFIANRFIIQEPLQFQTLIGIGLILLGTILLTWIG